MSTLVDNERVKLFATYCNNSAIAGLLGAFITPALNLAVAPYITGLLVAAGMVWSLTFHLMGREHLKYLKE